MPGYASQTTYEEDLLQAYRKRGRLPTIRKRDVNLALSPYKAPNRIGGMRVPKKFRGDTLTYSNVRRILGRRASDTKTMAFAVSTVLKKDAQQRARAAIRRRRRQR